MAVSGCLIQLSFLLSYSKMSTPQVSLYGGWDSDCSARLRLALQLKNIHYEYIPVTDQNAATYKEINPSGSIPTLVIQEGLSSSDQRASKPTMISQSLAALEYLEETFPPSSTGKALLRPTTSPRDRATIRCLMNIIASDVHPLTTARVCRRICEQFPCPASETAAATGNIEWDRFWIRRGLAVYEDMIRDTSGTYSVGEDITLADVCLLPAVWTAERCGVSLDGFPGIVRVVGGLCRVEAVRRAHWRCQVDTPEGLRVSWQDL